MVNDVYRPNLFSVLLPELQGDYAFLSLSSPSPAYLMSSSESESYWAGLESEFSRFWVPVQVFAARVKIRVLRSGESDSSLSPRTRVPISAFSKNFVAIYSSGENFWSEHIHHVCYAYSTLSWLTISLQGIEFIIIIIIIISLTSIFFQDKSRVWTAASQQH